MNCEIIKNFIITDYIDQEIDDRKFKYVKDHLEHCVLCREFERSLVKVNGTIKYFENIKPPESLWLGIKNNIVSLKVKPKKERSFFRYFKMGLQDVLIFLRPRLVAVVVLLFIGIVMFTKLSIRNTRGINEYIGDQMAFLTSLDKNSMDYEDMFFVDYETSEEEYFF
ncbi:MAG: hypothetical protein KAJ79_04775 [Candidatus Omnitrophica bacterium]|nr:hypothetical protein [Candidatus Omnitrophota bacterium]MCK5288355.1 hypothetical protein [Candidatus Omnitrophota bacterium]